MQMTLTRAMVLGFCAITLSAQNVELEEALLTAARKGDLDGVKAAIAKGAPVEAKTRHGITPLYYATINGHEAVVKFLLEKGADVNIADTFYKAPAVSFALDRGHPETAKLLIEKGCKYGPEVLTPAAKGGHSDLVKAILAQGQVKPAQLTSALAAAESEKKTDVVEILKAAGAKPHPVVQLAPGVLESYAGQYKSERGEFTVTVKDGKLSGGPPGQIFDLVPTDQTTFRIAQFEGVLIKFKVAGAKASAVSIEQGGGTFEYKRVEDK